MKEFIFGHEEETVILVVENESLNAIIYVSQVSSLTCDIYECSSLLLG